MHPCKNNLAQTLARAVISLLLGGLRWRSIVARCGSMIICKPQPRATPADRRGAGISGR